MDSDITVNKPIDQRIRDTYTPTQITTILLWLALRGYDYDAVASEMNIHPDDLRYISRSSEFGRPLDRLLEITIETLLLNIPDRMSARDWISAVTQLLDRLIIMRGGATERTEQISRTSHAELDFTQVLNQATKIMNGEAILQEIEQSDD